MAPGNNNWVDSLSEEWVSQPSSSPAGSTLNALLSSTTRSRALSSSTNSTTGTMAIHKPTRLSDAQHIHDWKRQVLGESGPAKDMFTPMQLESLFRPPTLGPNSSPSLVLHPTPPKPQRQQPAKSPTQTPAQTPTKTPRKSFLPVPKSLGMVQEEGTLKKEVRKFVVKRYQGLDNVLRSTMPEEAEEMPARAKPRFSKPSGRWARGGNERVSPPASASGEDEEQQSEEEEDVVGELRYIGGRENVQEPETSMYPSSPPFMGHYRTQEDSFDDSHLDDSNASVKSPFKSPSKTPSRTPVKSAVPAQLQLRTPDLKSRKPEPGSSGEDDPFFTPHPFRVFASSTPPGEPRSAFGSAESGESRNRTPMKLFHTNYDTYTAEMLSKRVEEMEESMQSASEDEKQPPAYAGDETPSERSFSGGSFSGGSAIVSRLEAMARKSEEENSPSRFQKINYRQRVRKERTVVEETNTVTTTTTASSNGTAPTLLSRNSSAPSGKPSDLGSTRKHRRWHSNESIGKNDGIEGPKSPLVDPMPKRVRRTISGNTESQEARKPLLRIRGNETPRRNRIRSAIEVGSILANSSRRRSRANTAESRLSANRSKTQTPTPTPRKKLELKKQEEGTPLAQMPAARRSRKTLVFSGRRGDGMQGEDFRLPEIPHLDDSIDEEVRRSSFTTESWLQQAQEVMESIRRKQGSIYSTDNESSPGKDYSFSNILPTFELPGIMKNLHIPATPGDDQHMLMNSLQDLRIEGAPPTRSRDDGSNKSSRLSVSSGLSHISNAPDLLKHHLATKNNDMTFDEQTRAWISKTPGQLLNERDPFSEISDLTVDSKEDEKARRIANAKWNMLGSTPDGVERSGMWRSSRLVEVENEFYALGSSVGSTTDSAFGTRSNTESGTRTTSYGTTTSEGKETVTSKGQATTLDIDVSELQPGVETAPPSASSNQFSSPFKEEDQIDGFLEHGSLRQKNVTDKSQFNLSFRGSGRRRSGRLSFLGKPVGKIAETEEEFQPSFHPDIATELRKLAINNNALTPNALTPLRSTQLKRSWSAPPPPSTQKKADVSFHLTPLPDLSYQFETTEALISLELSYIGQRRGPKATGKAIENSFTIARSDLIKHVTDVEPYEPYWGYIKTLKLTDRKIETLHTLNEWCPRLTVLDVSNNELGQLTGVPEDVLDLKVAKNCLSNATFFGHLLNLQFLDVSGNGLQDLHSLKACKHLRELRADDNELKNIDGIYGLEGLTKLRCRRNRIQNVDLSKAELNRLVELDLRGNEISEISGIECLPSLAHLNLDQNNITSLPLPPKTKLPTLRSLKLTQNNIKTFDFAPFPSLQVCYMDNNRLTHLTHFTTLTKIDAISLRTQSLRPSHRNTLPLSRLLEARKIYLSSNTISPQLHALTIPFLNTQYLELASCQLRTLPTNFADIFPNLRVLNINYNQISDLTPLTGCTRLLKLLAVGNAIKSFPGLKHTLEYLPMLRFVDLRANPLTLPFYPPAVSGAVVNQDEEYEKTPYEMPKCKVETDEAWVTGMDLEGRCRRRRYEVLLGICCGALEELDGRRWEHEKRGERGDEVWAEMVARGWVLEVQEDEDEDEEEYYDSDELELEDEHAEGYTDRIRYASDQHEAYESEKYESEREEREEGEYEEGEGEYEYEYEEEVAEEK